MVDRVGRPPLDLLGAKYGRFTVLERAGTDAARNSLWLCKCDCGATAIIRGHKLKSGDAQACGCRRRERGREIGKMFGGRFLKPMKGVLNPRWNNGGSGSLGHKIRSHEQYREWVEGVFSRDNFTCQNCSKHGGTLHAHHIHGFHEIVTANGIDTVEVALSCGELWDIGNGETLCVPCHKLMHKKAVGRLL